MASRAGAKAEAKATIMPVSMPVQISPPVRRTGAGRLVVKRAFTEQAPQQSPESGAGRAEQQGFREKEQKNREARGAQRAQDSDFTAPAHHADRDGVVDQERAYNQRNIAQHPQVPVEGAQHVLVLFAARAGPFDQVRGRKQGADGGFDARQVLTGVERNIDAVEFAVAVEKLLRVGDIDGDEFGAPGIGDVRDGKHVRAATEVDGELRRVIEAPGEGFGENRRGRKSDGIDAVERHGADTGDIGLGFENGGEVRVDGKRIEAAEPLFIDAAVSEDFEIGLPGDGGERGAEGAGGGVAGEIDRDDDGNPESHRENGERGAQPVAAQRAQNEGAEELHARSMDSIRPSRRRTRVPAMAAASVL